MTVNNDEFDICVGVPTYNEAPYIVDTLASLAAQRGQSYHFMMLDNASSDHTLEIAREAFGHDERFSFHQNDKNRGANYSFKALLDNAPSSRYFMWLGGHDAVSPGYLETAMTLLDEDESLAMACGMPYKVMKELPEPEFLELDVYPYSHKRLGRYLQSIRHRSHCSIIHSVFRRHLLDGFPFKLVIAGDLVLISHLLWHGQVYYMQDERYWRRYFREEDIAESFTRRTSATDDYFSRYELICYYLDSFGALYKGDSRMKTYIEQQMIEVFQHRYGIQSLIPNDEI
ncbi:hypothetical protein WH50_04625 [Pokkaliibacter plantistimulans]|uniref:Glycosyltransferase 2-like domain-containing protein n=1 Tax=Pokkaliibacter plantistimulans TaxID=1635171 RepID=A0ABX5M0D6_9GAMM|nr:glycosyltransferase family 2 protein [Pokkaliibacter plantistimulans]PXF32382.1 hypothetical protein WH50_04625 [Pokkaliibacter plantistimulans]